MKNKTINICSLTKGNFSVYKSEIIELYRKVFSESNWKEWWKCSCWFQESYSEIPDWICPRCQNSMNDYYSQEEIVWFVTDLFEREYFQALLWLSAANKVVAFTWWWLDSLEELNTEKLWLSDSDFEKLWQVLQKIGLDIEQDFYYQSETWVSPQERWNNYGNTMIETNQDLLEENRERVWQILQRTSRQSRMFQMRLKQWYDLVYEYKDKAQRVLFAKKI